MPHRDRYARLRHMLAHAREAVTMLEGKTRPDLDADRQLNLSLVRLLEIVGVAATRVPQPERALYPDLPWAQMVSLRNRLIHGYDEVDFEILWQIVKQDLPLLILALEKILPRDPPSR